MRLTQNCPDWLTPTVQSVANRSPAIADRALETLNIFLQSIRTSSKEDEWTFSHLNKNGFPVEFTFSSLDSGLRYTTEVAGSAVDPHNKLNYALRLLDSLGAASLSDRAIARLHQIQSSGSLEWGTWIGVRHRQDRDTYKLYTQIPVPAAKKTRQLLQNFLDTDSLLPNHAAIPVAIGQECSSERIEFYFRINHLGIQPAELHHLLQRCGLAAKTVELLNFIATIRNHTVWQPSPTLPEVTYGFSISLGHPTVFSLFTFPGSLMGGDGKIRAAVLATAKQQGWDFRDYARMSQPLANWLNHNRHHNAIAFLVAPHSPLGLHISLSPPLETK
jgi:hypothetical protein